MYYLVSMDRNSVAASDCEIFKKCRISSAVGGTDGDMLWNGSKEGGDDRSECEEDAGTDREGGDSDTDW
jgi:hypothetical protein